MTDSLPFRNTKGVSRTDKLHYVKVHAWIKKQKPKPKKCEKCGNDQMIIDYANLSQEYRFDVNDWMCLCRACHIAIDSTGSVFGRKIGRQYAWKYIAKHPEELVIDSNNPKRDKEIVLAWSQLKYTYKQIGLKHGIQSERVRQIIAKAIHKLERDYAEKNKKTNKH